MYSKNGDYYAPSYDLHGSLLNWHDKWEGILYKQSACGCKPKSSQYNCDGCLLLLYFFMVAVSVALKAKTAYWWNQAVLKSCIYSVLSGLFWSPITKTCYQLSHVVIYWNVDCHWLGSHPSHLGRWDWCLSHQSEDTAGITVCQEIKKWYWHLNAETEIREHMTYKWRSETRFTTEKNESLK